MELKICHLLPELLDLYGDRGNLIAMKKRLEWRGVDCTVSSRKLGEKTSLAGFDLVFIGGGQEFDYRLLAAELSGGLSVELKAAVNDGLAMLAVGSGYQLLGQYGQDEKGVKTALSGAVDMYTVAGKSRSAGNYKFICDEKSGGFETVGFENHLGRTYLGAGLPPLGRVVCGCGNNGEDGGEGLRLNNLFASYSHGPLLPKNPGLCDFILACALGRRYGRAELAPLEDFSEKAAHGAMDKILSR